MRKSVVLILFSIVLITPISLADEIFSEKYLFPIDISGKILDQDGKPFTDKVILHLRTETVTKEQEEMGDYSGIEKIYEQEVSGGHFNWKGRATSVDVKVIKEGYYSTLASPDMTEVGDSFEIKADGILIYLVQKGTPSTLEYTEGASVPGKKNEKSEGKQCGWSFKKRWYFPVDGEEPVDIIRGVSEDKKITYTIKEPGGFIYFSGYPEFESQLNKPWADFDWMPQAPESGYIQTVSPDDHKDQQQYQYAGSIYYYFRTSDGRFGKIVFQDSSFDYYLQPDGSRNLEAGEVVEVGPTRPEYRERLEKEQRGY